MFVQTVIFSILFLESKWELKPFNSLILSMGEIFIAMPGISQLSSKGQMDKVVSRLQIYLFVSLSVSVSKKHLVVSQISVDDAFLSIQGPSVGYLSVLNQKWEKAWKAGSWLAPTSASQNDQTFHMPCMEKIQGISSITVKSSFCSSDSCSIFGSI